MTGAPTRMHLSVVRPISIPFNSLRSSPNWVLAWWMTSVFTPSSVALAFAGLITS